MTGRYRDSGDGDFLDNGYIIDDVVERLNEQDNEIKRLKKTNEELITIIKGISEDSAKAIVDLWQNVVYE